MLQNVFYSLLNAPSPRFSQDPCTVFLVITSVHLTELMDKNTSYYSQLNGGSKVTCQCRAQNKGVCASGSQWRLKSPGLLRARSQELPQAEQQRESRGQTLLPLVIPLVTWLPSLPHGERGFGPENLQAWLELNISLLSFTHPSFRWKAEEACRS